MTTLRFDGKSVQVESTLNGVGAEKYKISGDGIDAIGAALGQIFNRTFAPDAKGDLFVDAMDVDTKIRAIGQRLNPRTAFLVQLRTAAQSMRAEPSAA